MFLADRRLAACKAPLSLVLYRSFLLLVLSSFRWFGPRSRTRLRACVALLHLCCARACWRLRSEDSFYWAASGSLETYCPSPPLPFLPTGYRAMADAPAAQNQGDRRRQAEVRADRENEARSVRQRLDETETRVDGVDSRLRGHETCLKCLEAFYRIVLRGFTSVREFMAIFDGGEFKGPKTAFIPSFVRPCKKAEREHARGDVLKNGVLSSFLVSSVFSESRGECGHAKLCHDV